jgi:hypothetical protein
MTVKNNGEGELFFQKQQVDKQHLSEAFDNTEKESVLREMRPSWTCPLSGNIYTGEWLGDIRDGVGTQIWAINGTVYEGDWRNNVPHGYGKFTKANGDIHEGNWNKGRAHGMGIFI